MCKMVKDKEEGYWVYYTTPDASFLCAYGLMLPFIVTFD